MQTRVRPVRESDAEAIAAIYAPIVEQTAISFEEVAPRAQEIASRIAGLKGEFPWLVAERNRDVSGYAYAGRHRERAAYRWSVNVSVYVDHSTHRRGIARALYGVLFELLKVQGYHHVFAGITIPNDASIGLHRALGFEPVGVYQSVGFKFGKWRDTSWWQRPLQKLDAPAREPIAFSALETQVVEAICGTASNPATVALS
jgi:phosphinothricin acetyltransferase